ncbi:DapH/DapD/GlmU-related protein [Microbacterium sp. 1.5R]|uniref:acyltransferase n=1 Tax=Microbacterium sp. 1.5R TaxID=1916917 RepID=UPI00119F19DA|nr:DapH/DapD/GlmU-related protein [Microbacterium sp. 1.5R]
MPDFSGLPARLLRGAKWSAYRRAAEMVARGMLRKPFLGASGGPLFIGRRVRISNPSFIRHAGRLVVEDGVELQGLSKNGVVFGAEVSIGQGTAIRPSSYYGGEVGEGLRVGDRSSFATGCFIGCSGSIVIGDDVMLGPGVRIYSENHVFSDASVTIKSQGVERGAVVIGDDCWIGSGVTITSGVTIGRGVVIGSGSVVTRDIPAFSIAAGSPAKVIRSRKTDADGVDDTVV